ncbi:uncharacterized protein LOC117811853 [Notolabrus celidotus]|uniref:uncharacterized protein LOC117811853 n=1 Tax=Notolabrus celidotus TaxID=1203425 RepID=UPI0014906417|nr:uncharacterized protein LOC117811853 [Notolabrus celidotus]
MLLLPAAALCCLCSALLTMQEELIQDDLTLTRSVGEEVSFSCGRTDHCDEDWVCWYQKKDTETFRGIICITGSNGDIYRSYNHPQVDDFSAVNKQNGSELQIQSVERSHSATYYCSCWKPTVRNDPSSLNKNQQMNRCDSESSKPQTETHCLSCYMGQYVSAPRICMPCLTDLDRAHAILQLQAGVPPNQDVALFGVSPRTIAKVKAKFQITGKGCEKPLMELKYDPGSSSDSFSSTQVFVALFLTVEGGGLYYLIFGSGTKLFVTDEPVVKPVVSVYPAASRAQLEGKSSLLCVASDMFPPLVQISWKRRKGDGQLEAMPPAESKIRKLRESGCTASILIVPQRENSTDRYLCSVKHEGFKVTSRTGQALFRFQCRMKLLSLLYSLLILKSLVYCCGLSLLRILINKPPSISCTCADRLSPAGQFSPSDLISSPL